MSLHINRSSQLQNTQSKVVYFRRKNKHSYAVEVGDSVDLERVVRMIGDKEGISWRYFALFHKGKPLMTNNHCT